MNRQQRLAEKRQLVLMARSVSPEYGRAVESALLAGHSVEEINAAMAAGLARNRSETDSLPGETAVEWGERMADLCALDNQSSDAIH